MIHRIVLEINHESGNPSKWDWGELIDEQVDLISVTEMPELTTAQVNFLTDMLNSQCYTRLGECWRAASEMTNIAVIESCEDAAVHDSGTVQEFVSSLGELVTAYGPNKFIEAVLPGEDDEEDY